MRSGILVWQKRKTKPIPRWTLKKLVQWIQQKWKINCCRETVRKALKKMSFSWKKAKKLLNKASKVKRDEFLQKITELLDDALHQRHLLLYIDEAHIHLDTDEGYGWSIEGKRFWARDSRNLFPLKKSRCWVSSSSPGRKKVSFYGVYIYNQATTRIFPYEKAEKNNTIDVLTKLRTEFPGQKMTIIWDGSIIEQS